MIQPIIGKAPRVERDWESYSFVEGREKEKRKNGERNCARERRISWLSIWIMDVFMASMIEHCKT